MPVERAIPPEIISHVADPIRQDIGFEAPLVFGGVVAVKGNTQDPLPPNETMHQDIAKVTEEKPRIVTRQGETVTIRDRSLPYQGESTRFTHKDTRITIVAFGPDATRLSHQYTPKLSSRNR